jgi:hypothetical protein
MSREDGKDRSIRILTLLLILCSAALLSRLMPLSISQYPYNNDSLSESGMASEILKYGHLKYTEGSPWYGTHSVATPALSLLSAFCSSVIGVTPLESAQFLTAIFSVLTVGAVFLLAVRITGQVHAGLIASVVTILFGTLVFTTGSSWREALGIALLVMVFYTFTQRSSFRFRILFFILFAMLLITHHLVAAIGYIAIMYLLLWSWIVAIAKKDLRRRHLDDAITVLPLTVLAALYYSFALTDRQALFGTGIRITIFVASFAVLSLMSYFFLSMRKHSKMTFAPIVAAGLGLFLFLDYSGFFFDYVPSANDAYLVLVVATAFIVGIAWYGAELIIETRPNFKAVHMALFVSPFSLILFAVAVGPDVNSHQIIYRTFDFLDFFIVIGVGAAVGALHNRRRKAYGAVALAVFVAASATFPFGYYSASLLGVRHDTQAYEVDALQWISDNSFYTVVVSDERLSFIALNTIWVEKRSYLPNNLLDGVDLDRGYFYVLEDDWSSQGVNVFPSGLAVIPESAIENVLYTSNVLYIGGPADDRVLVFSEMGIPPELW